MAFEQKYSIEVLAKIPYYGTQLVTVSVDRDFHIAVHGKVVSVRVKDRSGVTQTVTIERTYDNGAIVTSTIKDSTLLQLWKSRVPADVTEWACSS